MSLSLRAAINGKCKDCIYDPCRGGGTWREQVAQCSAATCPLWPIRPLPRSGPWSGASTDPATVTRAWLNAPIWWGQSNASCGRTSLALTTGAVCCPTWRQRRDTRSRVPMGSSNSTRAVAVTYFRSYGRSTAAETSSPGIMRGGVERPNFPNGQRWR